MPNTDHYEHEILTAYDMGQLKFIASKDELTRIRAAARATATKDKRVIIRSVLHKYVTGRLQER